MSEHLTSPSVPVTEMAPRSHLWRWLSIALMAGGLGLLAFGGWMGVQQWLEASKPLPARIVPVAAADLEQTPTPLAVATPTPAPPASPTRANAIASKGDALPAANTEPPNAAASQQRASAPETAAAQSLADNPLPVVDIETPPTVEAELSPAESDAADRPPLNRIVAESVALDAPIIDVGWEVVIQNTEPINVWTVADYAAGWHRNSMMPGEGGNVVLSGHHNIKGEVFRYIVDLEPGDIITLYNESGQAFEYAVEDKFIVKDKGEPDAVRRANARWIGPFNDERLTLVTCWPYTNNTHRVIVISKPVPAS